jgi:hypothetical protein
MYQEEKAGPTFMILIGRNPTYHEISLAQLYRAAEKLRHGGVQVGMDLTRSLAGLGS